MGNNVTTYEDERLTELETEKQQTLTETENTYQGMIDSSADFYQQQKEASEQWADKQTQLQQEQTDFAIDQIEQQKEEAEADYKKEQKAAYVDYQKQKNDYSVGAEQRAESGLSRTGYSESSQVALYTAYQNRVATAREAMQKTIQNYDNQMTEARLQNNVALAQIAHDNLMKQLEFDLQGFQYGNQLLLEKLNSKLNINTTYHSMEQNILSQINQEKALAEQIRQFNEQMAEEKRQANANYALNKAQLAEEKRQFDETMNYNKYFKSGGGGGSESVNNSVGVVLEDVEDEVSTKNNNNPINKLIDNSQSKVVAQTKQAVPLSAEQKKNNKGYSLVKDILGKGIT